MAIMVHSYQHKTDLCNLSKEIIEKVIKDVILKEI